MPLKQYIEHGPMFVNRSPKPVGYPTHDQGFHNPKTEKWR